MRQRSFRNPETLHGKDENPPGHGTTRLAHPERATPCDLGAFTGPVGRRLILDTNVLVAYERGTIDRDALDADELAMAAVSVAEYRVGIELADTPARAADRARALVAITPVVEVLDYTEATAACYARLIAHVRRSGTPRGAHDLIIAAHAAQSERTIVTFDAKARFADLPGVRSTTP